MGFFEGLGNFLGGMAGGMKQLADRANMYRPEYECMSNSELREELHRWQKRGGSEGQARVLAIRMTLRDRGAM